MVYFWIHGHIRKTFPWASEGHNFWGSVGAPWATLTSSKHLLQNILTKALFWRDIVANIAIHRKVEILRSIGNSERCQTSKIERFVKFVKAWSLLTIFAKHSILDVWQDSECAFAKYYPVKLKECKYIIFTSKFKV